MKKWSRRTKWFLGIGAGFGALFLLFFGSLFLIGYFNLFHAHEHCSKVLGSALLMYAHDHEGQYPYHTNGFGDALLLLVKGGELPDVHWITAPGDDGTMYRRCLTNSLDVPENQCTRIYIQGLSESNAADRVALVFDKYPTPGGDHFRHPWREPTRDVVMSDHFVEWISEKRWPAFAREQIAKLVKLGFEQPELESLFAVQTQQSPTR